MRALMLFLFEQFDYGALSPEQGIHKTKRQSLSRLIIDSRSSNVCQHGRRWPPRPRMPDSREA